MTEDQIKAIAEEYATRKACCGVSKETIQYIAEKFLKDLFARYCIVEREKVMEKYNEVKAINDACDGLLADDRAVFHYLFGTSMFNQNEAQYTAQCETCMRKLAGEVLEVCKDANDQNSHCQWDGGKPQDFCVYKIFWDRYTEAHWQSVLTAEQFAKAKSLNQNKE